MNTEVYQDILKELSPYGARLIAVSKTRSVEDIQELYDLGQRDFGENRIKELNDKAILLPQDIRWHLIGPLQSKKVKLYTSNIHLFHALDRKKIWNKLNSWAENENTVVSALLQIHIARESSKSGFDDHEIRSLLSDGIHEDLPGVRIRGLMGMATFTDDMDIVREEFETLKELFEDLQKKYFDPANFNELSMGMSGDYRIALEQGATMVRIGSRIFGPREQ